MVALFHRDIVGQQIKAMLLYYGALPLLVLGPGFLLDRLLALPLLPGGMEVVALALVLALGGVGLITWSTIDLQRQGNGTPSPFRPARRLVTEGSYRLCRHPMFLGYDLVLLAAILLIRSSTALLVTYPLFLLWSIVSLRREERILASRFGDDYGRYRQTVPFLLPCLRRPTNR